LLGEVANQFQQPEIKDHVRSDVEDAERFCFLFLDEKATQENRTPAQLAFVMRYATLLLESTTQRRKYWQQMFKRFGPDAIVIEA
jgi:hypothetical protein